MNPSPPPSRRPLAARVPDSVDASLSTTVRLTGIAALIAGAFTARGLERWGLFLALPGLQRHKGTPGSTAVLRFSLPCVGARIERNDRVLVSCEPPDAIPAARNGIPSCQRTSRAHGSGFGASWPPVPRIGSLDPPPFRAMSPTRPTGVTICNIFALPRWDTGLHSSLLLPRVGMGVSSCAVSCAP